MLIFSFGVIHAQQFINSGKIEYEVRVNNYKVMGDDVWTEMFKDKVPQFEVSWYDYTFNDNKAIYKFNRRIEQKRIPWDDGADREDNIWYSDYSKGFFSDQKNVYGNTYLLNDSLMKIIWRISPNETREIAGFLCRKATGVIFDSVYVFAFYTDEITISGGPMGIHGLPGMILGITIPRMFTSWIATKLEIAGFDKNQIIEPQKGKKSKATELMGKVKEVNKDYGSYGQQEVWKLFL